MKFFKKLQMGLNIWKILELLDEGENISFTKSKGGKVFMRVERKGYSSCSECLL